jgi:HAD superfamily hydrolase (TIGR01509 family)
MPQRIAALIFDFDGLILDTEASICQSWQEIYQGYGFELPMDQWVTTIGTYEEPFDPFAYLQEQVGRPLDAEVINRAQAAREAELAARLPLRPGVVAYLQEARRLELKIGLASSSKCGWVTGHLERLGLRAYFDCIRVKEDVRVTKPDPEVYLSAAAGLGVQPAEAIALEDSPLGVLAAKRAGMFCVVVPNPLTRQLPLDHADLRLESLEDLPLAAVITLARQRAP